MTKATRMKTLVLIASFLILGSGALDSNTLENNSSIPVVIITWDYTDATQKAWEVLYDQSRSALDAVEVSCTICEEQQCRKTVGFGGSPDENGETTLDALIMDGVTMDVGGVGGLRHVKNAIGVARKVLENTRHSLLGGDLATDFAVKMGFAREPLETDESKNMWSKWKSENCQPNFWKNVDPDPRGTCGPYHPLKPQEHVTDYYEYSINEDNHDTIGVIAIDKNGKIAAGTSTNGANHKIPGRIGDSPIAGAGAYADQQVGAAAGTGDGDVMMRFLPSFLAVEEMRRGASPNAAATLAIERIAEHYPDFVGAVIAVNKNGEYGAACNGLPKFPHYVVNPELGKPTMFYTPCIQTSTYSVVDSRNCEH